MPHDVHAKQFTNLLTQMRQHLHSIPELMYEEYKTSEYIVEKLGEFGVTNITKVVGTGVVAEVGSSNGPVIGIRVEMDALPMEEPHGLSFRWGEMVWLVCRRRPRLRT